jgi:DNA topoisomerase-1
MDLVSKVENKIDRISISDEVSDVVCEKCGENMVIKRGRYGRFLACPGFPDCKNTKPYLQVSDFPCPKCGKKLVIKKARKGNIFYVCENSPECDFISWKAPKVDNRKKQNEN